VTDVRPRNLRFLIPISLVMCVTAMTCSPGEDSNVVEMDRPLPRLAGETLDGARLDAAAHAGGEVLVINVWAHDCAPCRTEQPDLVELADRYEDEGVRFLGINYDDDLDAARAWVGEFDVPYPSLFDPSGRTAAQLGYPALPDTYVVDREGTIRWVVFGATDGPQLAGLIDDVLA
jgi:thiol-disulfide isomerase/thioredoxin